MISIDWGTQIIFVPKAATTLIQSTPIEIRELNINDFRLILKGLEATAVGIPHLRTHTHNTEVSLGGIVYARVVEIINGYTITFEDGSYAVNLVGANSNIGDVVNLNQVSIRSSNSAGLISNQAIEFSSFNGGVTVDAINGVTGTVFPRGTPQQPVNNIPDAILIAELRGFDDIFIKNNFTFSTGDILSNYNIHGDSIEDSTLIFETGAVVGGVKLFEGTISGIFDNTANFTDCNVGNVSFVSGSFTRCILSGEIQLAGGAGDVNFLDCKDGLTLDAIEPSINFSGSTNSLAIRNYDGDISIHNKNGPEAIEANVSTGGHIKLESTITNGNIRITGIAEVTDDSASGATIDVSQVIFPNLTQLAAFNGAIHLDVAEGISGTKFPIGTHDIASNNILDAIAIAELRNLHKIIVGGTLVLTDTDVTGFSFVGENLLSSVIVLTSGNTTTETTFKDLLLVGQLSGYTYAEGCALQSLSNIGDSAFPTIFRDCIFRADTDVSTPALQLANISGGQNVHFINCVSGVPGEGTSTLDYNSSDFPIAFRKYGGGITIKNITGNQDSTFEFDQGQIVLDSSCTSGKVRLGGIYKLTDNSNILLVEERNQSITDNVSFSGTVTGDTAAIAAAVWDKLTNDHQNGGSFGKLLTDLIDKADLAQHILNVNTDMLIDKPNKP
tara:strand:+ start:19748 stop:21757 length:2010 start_codon:yes stop_codon:yes gene_type:complete